jgi:hypothetical protein
MRMKNGMAVRLNFVRESENAYGQLGQPVDLPEQVHGSWVAGGRERQPEAR